MTTVTIKANNLCIQKHPKINKVIATIDARSFARIIDVIGLTANPRKAKSNKITQAIAETLDSSPEMMRFASKGLLISTLECKHLERSRITLSFDESYYEGVLDGGHNMLAVGLFILKQFLVEDVDLSDLRKVRNWDQFVSLWKNHREKIKDERLQDDSVFSFEIPVEIIYPHSDTEPNAFIEDILEISSARNNNCSLTEGAQANFRGDYEVLKQVIDLEIEDKIQWKDNDSDKPIKRDDIVAMALIPLFALQAAGKLKESLPEINLVTMYSSKGKCVQLYSEIYKEYSDDEGNISNPLVKSGLEKLKDLPRLYDYIYTEFPDAYNGHSKGFGRIKCVQSRRHVTKFYKQECDTKYPDGFIMPIFCGLSTMMQIKGERLEWVVNPDEFLQKNLPQITKWIVNTIKDNNYNPGSVGKNKGAYDNIFLVFNYLLKEKLDSGAMFVMDSASV